MTAFFLDFDCIAASGRTRRTSRKPSLSETSRGLFAYRSELMASALGGGASEQHTDLRSTPAPRAPRTQRRTSARKPASSDGDSDGEGEPAPRFSISAVAHEGLTVQTADGQRATLAVIDTDGNVIADDVAREAWSVAVHAYKAFLEGSGHLRIHAAVPIVAA